MAVKDIYQLHGPIDTADLVDQVNRFMNRLMTRLDGSDSELASSLATLTANLADLLADFEAHNHAFVDLSDVDMEDVAHGDLPFRGASAWENLPAGEDGQILTTHGVDADPTWADQLEPADTVEDETTWGITPDAGTAETYSRSDHTHGTPAEPSVSVEDAWPIGSVFLAVVATDPATLLGFGTWARIAEGQLLAGYKSGDADFGTVEGTGGTKTHTLTSDEMPSHTHVQDAHDHDISAYIRAASSGSVTTTIVEEKDTTSTSQAPGTTKTTTTTATNQNTGGGEAHNNLPPYVVVYVWKRTA